MTPMSALASRPPASRPLTNRELARLLGYLAAGTSLHLDQQRALAAEVLRLRAAAGTERRQTSSADAP